MTAYIPQKEQVLSLIHIYGVAALMDYDEENILISLYIQSVSKAKAVSYTHLDVYKRQYFPLTQSNDSQTATLFAASL